MYVKRSTRYPNLRKIGALTALMFIFLCSSMVSTFFLSKSESIPKQDTNVFNPISSALPNLNYSVDEQNPRDVFFINALPDPSLEISRMLASDIDNNGVMNLITAGDCYDSLNSYHTGIAAFYNVTVDNMNFLGSYNTSYEGKYNDVALAENLFMNGTNYVVLGGSIYDLMPGWAESHITVLKAYQNGSSFKIEELTSITLTMESVFYDNRIISIVVSDYDNDKVQEILFTGVALNGSNFLDRGFYGCLNLTLSYGTPVWQLEFLKYLPIDYEEYYFVPTKIDVFENFANNTLFISGYSQDRYTDVTNASVYFEQYYFNKPLFNCTALIEAPELGQDKSIQVVDFEQVDIYNDFSNTIVFLLKMEDREEWKYYSRLVTGKLTYPSTFSVLIGNEQGMPFTTWEEMEEVEAKCLYVGDLNRDGSKSREFVVGGVLNYDDGEGLDDYDYLTVFEFSKTSTTGNFGFKKAYERGYRNDSSINDITMCYLNGTVTGILIHAGMRYSDLSGQGELLIQGLLYPHVNEGIDSLIMRYQGYYDNPSTINGSTIESFAFGDVDYDGKTELVSIGTTNFNPASDGNAKLEIIIWDIDSNTGNFLPNVTWAFSEVSGCSKSFGADIVIYDSNKDGKDEIYVVGKCWNNTAQWQALVLYLQYRPTFPYIFVESKAKFQISSIRNTYPTCIDIYRNKPANETMIAVGGTFETGAPNQQYGFLTLLTRASYPKTSFMKLPDVYLFAPNSSAIYDLKIGDVDLDGTEEIVTVGDKQWYITPQTKYAQQVVWNHTGTMLYIESELLWKNPGMFRITQYMSLSSDPFPGNPTLDASFYGLDFNDWDHDGKIEIFASGCNGMGPGIPRYGDGIIVATNVSYSGILRFEFQHWLNRASNYDLRREVSIRIGEIDFDNALEFCSLASLTNYTKGPYPAFQPLLSEFNSTLAPNFPDGYEFPPNIFSPMDYRGKAVKIDMIDIDGDGIKEIFTAITNYATQFSVNINVYQKAIRHDFSRPIVVKLNSTELITDSFIQIGFNVSDPANNLQTFWIRINHGMIVDSSQANIEWIGNVQKVTYNLYTAMLNPGDNLIEIFANDTVGNLNDTEYYNVFLDQLPPIVQINYPTDGTYITSDFNFEVEIFDGGRLDTMWYQIGDVNRTFTENGTIYLSELDLIDEGPFELKFFANDTVGHLNWNSRTLYKETQVPIVEIYSPTDGVYLNYPPYMEAYIYDANIDRRWYEFDNNGTFFDFSNSTMNSDIWNSLSEGGHLLTVYGNDSVNNLNYCNIVFIKDTLIPTIDVISPGNLTQSNSPPVIHIVVYDADCCVEISFSLNGSDPISISNDTDFYMEYYMWDDYLDGEWAEIKFNVTDTAGNMNTTVIILVQKSSSISIPNIIIHEPSSDNQWFSSPPNFYVEFLDPLLDKTYFIIDSNGTKFEYYDNMPFSESRWNFLTEGLHLFQFFANNTVGGLNWSEIYIGKDTIVPNVNVESPDNNHKFVNVFDYSLSITEIHLNDIWYTIDIETGEKTYLSGPSGTIDLSGLSDGIHQIYFWVSDLANNQQYRMINVIQDTTGPSFIGDNNLPFDAVLNQTFWFDFKVNELANAYYEIQSMPGTKNWLSPDGQFGDPDTEFYYEFNVTLWDQLDDGSYVIVLLVLDELGNGDAYYIKITKDTVIPELNEFVLFWNGVKITDIAQTITVTNRPVFIVDDPEPNPTVWRAFLVILRNQGPSGSWGSDYIVIEMMPNSEGNFEARVPEVEWPKKSQSFKVIISVLDFAGNENHWEINLYISITQKMDPILFIVIGAVGAVAAVGIVIGVRKKSSRKPVEIPAPAQGALKETEAKNLPSNGKGKTLPPIDLKHYEGIEGVSKSKAIPLPNTAPNNIQGKLPMQGKIPGAKLPGKGKGASAESEKEAKYVMSAQELADLKKTEEEVAVAKEKKICVVHKGPIGGSIYMCPECETFYCQKCAVSLKRAGDKCWTCGHEIDIYVPAEIETPAKSENGNTNGNVNGIKNGTHAEKTESIVQTDLNINKIAEEKPATEVVSTVEKMVQENNVLSEDIKTKLRNGILPEESNDEAFTSLVKQISTLITPEELEMLNLVTLNLNDVDKRKFLEEYLSLNASERLNLIKKMNSQQSTAEDEQ